MAAKKTPIKKSHFYILIGCAAVVFLVLVTMGLRVLLREDEGKRRKQIQMVTLLTPPPPPKVEELPPEPVKQEEKIETPPEKPDDQPEPPKEMPAQNLGIDADAGLGGDAFGLEARRGGSNLIGGGGAGSIYGWYANQVSSSLQKAANQLIQQEGGVPPGQWKKVSFEVTVDVFGKIQKFSITSSSGNDRIDGAVKRALQMSQNFEPPPPGMPKVMRMSVILQG